MRDFSGYVAKAEGASDGTWAVWMERHDRHVTYRECMAQIVGTHGAEDEARQLADRWNACVDALEELDSVGGDVPVGVDRAANILRAAVNGEEG